MVAAPKFIQAIKPAVALSGADRRKVSRHDVSALVQVANAAGNSAAMDVEDLSTHGCSIKGDATWLRLGMILSISLQDDPPVRAITRWVRGGVAGVEFFRPLAAQQLCWRGLLADQGF